VRLDLYQVDAFARSVFAGNPAAVVPLAAWLDDATLQAIAAENALSETAYLVPRPDGAYDLRWFTPRHEVDLCGHATLASASVVLETLQPTLDEVAFHTRSGMLVVRRDGERFVMDLPAAATTVVAEPPGALLDALGVRPLEVRAGADKFLAVFADERTVVGLRPDMPLLESLHPRGVIATAPGDDVDFVSRYFAPSYGIPEDPVTGSAHCLLVPYWHERLKRTRLRARQVSARGGELACEYRGARVHLAGHAVRYLEGVIHLPDPG
jgi:PhzF family phenazine biosynthesis protein